MRGSAARHPPSIACYGCQANTYRTHADRSTKVAGVAGVRWNPFDLPRQLIDIPGSELT